MPDIATVIFLSFPGLQGNVTVITPLLYEVVTPVAPSTPIVMEEATRFEVSMVMVLVSPEASTVEVSAV